MEEEMITIPCANCNTGNKISIKPGETKDFKCGNCGYVNLVKLIVTLASTKV